MTAAPDLLTRLVDVLDNVSHALETGQADDVLAAEEPLATVVNELRGASLGTLARQAAVRARVRDARLAIDRCRALGAASSDLAAVVAPFSYGPTGLRGPALTPARTVASRT